MVRDIWSPVLAQSSLMPSGTVRRCVQKSSRPVATLASRPVCSTQLCPEHRRLLPVLVASEVQLPKRRLLEADAKSSSCKPAPFASDNLSAEAGRVAPPSEIHMNRLGKQLSWTPSRDGPIMFDTASAYRMGWLNEKWLTARGSPVHKVLQGHENRGKG